MYERKDTLLTYNMQKENVACFYRTRSIYFIQTTFPSSSSCFSTKELLSVFLSLPRFIHTHTPLRGKRIYFLLSTIDGVVASKNRNNLWVFVIYHFHLYRCINPLLFHFCLTEPEFLDLQQLGYNKQNKCVDHLDPDNPKPTDARGSWQHSKFLISFCCTFSSLVFVLHFKLVLKF